jgi:minichromosome maintenance protein 10
MNFFLVSTPKQFVDLTKTASSEAINSAKQRAIDILKQRLAQKQITPIKGQSLVSADSTSPSSSSKRSSTDVDANHSSKRLKVSNNNNTEPDEQKSFADIMNMKSSYADLYSQMTLDEIFERYKKKENIEEKLLQIMERDIKVVVCRQCHYTAYKQSVLCKQKQHYVKICEVKQKFFECIECHKRIFTWSQYPVENCTYCHSLKGFRRTALIRERHGAKFEDEILLLRGEEEKFLNSFVTSEKLPNVVD